MEVWEDIVEDNVKHYNNHCLNSIPVINNTLFHQGVIYYLD